MARPFQLALPLQLQMCIRDSSYSLAWLTKALNIDNNNAHRALSDALATAELFIRMEKELVAFPDFLKEKLTQLSAGDGSALAAFVAKCCANHGAAAAPAAEKTARTPYQKREINEEFCLDIDSLDSFIGEAAEYKDCLLYTSQMVCLR